MNRRLSPVALVLALLAIAGCGPALSLHASVTALGTDILLGTPPTPAVVPGSSLPPVVPSFPGVPALRVPPVAAPSVPATVKPAPRSACPAASPFAVPAVPAATTIDNAPRDARYAYRTTGVAKLDGTTSATLAGNEVWTVAAQQPALPGQSTQFTVTHPSFNGSSVTDTFAVIPPPTDQNASVPQTPLTPSQTATVNGGLYLTRIATAAGNTTTTFAPTGPGIEWFELPAYASQTWHSQGTDPTAAISETVTGADLGDVRVNACGALLDAWKVQLTATILGVDENLTQTDVLAIGSEYGGLILSDVQTISGTAQGHDVDQKSTSVINSLTPIPAVAKK